MVSERRKEQWRRAANKYYKTHISKVKMKNKEFRKKWAEERRCVCCSIPLNEGENRTCTNCGGTINKEFAYAACSKRLA